ncbi:RNA 3'-terminal phosphate cyclase [Marinobacter sp. CA1]|uniref:RNA 3'-terminal phosphate cyclase n=1 Tax=Marinobacter sp. CA1 TaxID=2817656 RepID=UPI001D06378B|nr:RNA 3'-terminal phosphate cyclase [Marinobacter sp. CA1]UDL05355.1 RNA 3'-terminal phosphate cyclase [Marinobacter sp. CA1]
MHNNHKDVDGRQGEGGGQILRSSLTLALLHGHPLSIRHIRGKRPKPGLMRQHLACVRAAQAISGATVEGAELGSDRLSFVPGPVRGGDYHFDVGSAGSTTLVFQTIVLPLLQAAEPSTVRFSGGTHNPMAPSLTFLEAAFLPLLRRFGASIEIEVERWGYMPAGGGQWVAHIQPSTLSPIVIDRRPAINDSEVVAHLSNVRHTIGTREIDSYREHCPLPDSRYAIRHADADCPGNQLSHTLSFDGLNACFTALGQHRLRAETLAARLARRVQRFLTGQAALCEYLTDQAMLPLLVAGGGALSCSPLSEHARTNRALIEQLSGIRLGIEERPGHLILNLTQDHP